MRAWAVATPGPIDGGPLALVERPRPRARAGRGARPGARLRRVPHRPAPGRGRPRAPPPGRGPRPRGRRAGRRARRRAPAASRSASASASPGCATPAACAASAPAATRTSASRPVHRLGRRRRLRRATPCVRRALRLPRCPTVFADDEAAPAAVRRHHRLPRPAARRAAARRPARHLRLRRLGPPRRPGRARTRAPPCTCMTRSAEAQPARPRARRGVRRRRRRRAARAARRRHPLRPGRRARAGGAARARPGRHARHRRHPPERHPAARLRTTSCSRSASCAASPPTPGATARSCCALAAEIPIRRPPRSLPVRARPTSALADLAHDRVTGAAVLTFDA